MRDVELRTIQEEERTKDGDEAETLEDTVGRGEFRRTQAAEASDLGEAASKTALEEDERVCDRCKRSGVRCIWPKEKGKIICGTCSHKRQRCEINGKGVVEQSRQLAILSGDGLSGDGLSAQIDAIERELMAVGKMRDEVRDAIMEIAAEIRQVDVEDVPEVEEPEHEEPEHEVEEIVDSMLVDTHPICPLHYRVRWAHLSGTDEEYTWVPLIDLKNSKKAIRRFHMLNPRKPGYPSLLN